MMRVAVFVVFFAATPAWAEDTSSLLPIDLPDAERRVVADFQLDFAPVFTGLTGAPETNGSTPVEGTYQDTNLFLEGTAALGSRGILWPTLNLYGLGSGIFDLAGPSSAPPVHPSIAQRFGDARALFLHLAYVELEGIGEDGLLRDFHVRAGRQFHFSRVGLTFDGVTLGFDGAHAKAAVRVGSRSSIFDRTQGDSAFLGGGFLAGGDVGWDFAPEFPLAIEAEVLHFRRTVALSPVDRALEGGAADVEQRTTVGEVRISSEPSERLSLSAVAELTFPALSHLRAEAAFALGAASAIIGFDQKLGTDLFFDLAGGEGLVRRGRRTTYETFRLNLVDPQPYSDLDATFSIPIGWLELEPSAGFRVVYGDRAASSPYDATHARYGLSSYANLHLDEGNGLEAQLGFEGLIYFRGDTDEGNFRDRASGELHSHEVFGGLRYVHGGGFRGRRLLAGRTISVGLSAFGRFARFQSRFLSDQTTDDGAYGAGIDAQWQFTPYSSVRLAYEFARDSSVFYDYLGPFHGLRASLRGSF